MADAISGTLEGFDNLLKILQSIGDDKKVNDLLKRTNREMLKPVQTAMKAMSFPKRLVKNMSIRAAVVDGNKHPNAVVVGPTSDSFILRFLNTGTIERYTKTGAYRGSIQGKNIIQSVVDNQATKLQRDIPDRYGEDLVKLTAKDVKKINKNK